MPVKIKQNINININTKSKNQKKKKPTKRNGKKHPKGTRLNPNQMVSYYPNNVYDPNARTYQTMGPSGGGSIILNKPEYSMIPYGFANPNNDIQSTNMTNAINKKFLEYDNKFNEHHTNLNDIGSKLLDHDNTFYNFGREADDIITDTNNQFKKFNKKLSEMGNRLQLYNTDTVSDDDNKVDYSTYNDYKHDKLFLDNSPLILNDYQRQNVSMYHKADDNQPNQNVYDTSIDDDQFMRSISSPTNNQQDNSFVDSNDEILTKPGFDLPQHDSKLPASPQQQVEVETVEDEDEDESIKPTQSPKPKPATKQTLKELNISQMNIRQLEYVYNQNNFAFDKKKTKYELADYLRTALPYGKRKIEVPEYK